MLDKYQIFYIAQCYMVQRKKLCGKDPRLHETATVQYYSEIYLFVIYCFCCSVANAEDMRPLLIQELICQGECYCHKTKTMKWIGS